MSFDFYEKASTLDAIKNLSDVTPEVLTVLVELLTIPSYAAYFFDGLSDPRWVELLSPHGVFRDPPSGYAIWPQSMYLTRVARVSPEDVIDVLTAIDTSNQSIQRDALQAALQMPASHAARLVPMIGKWLADQHFEWLIPDIAKLLALLVAGREFSTAVHLFGVLTEPADKPDNENPESLESRHYTPRPRYSYTWLRYVVEAAMPLFDERAFEVLGLIREHLTQSNTQIGGHSYWRRAIEDHTQNGEYPEFLDTLLVLTRQLMEKLLSDVHPDVRNLAAADIH